MFTSCRSQPGYPLEQLLVAAVAMFAHAYSLTSLFPYVGYMVVDIGATDDVDKAGYYAGFVGAAFMAGRTVSSFFWGVVADSHGRKPVLLIGCANIAFLSLLFGLSTSFPMALTTRFLIGLGNGIAGTSKTLVAELCSEEYQPRAMGFVTATWSLGLTLGPAIGGITSRKAFGLPGLFGRYPYLLPNLIAAAIAGYAFYQTVFYLPETAPHLKKQTQSEKDETAVSDEEAGMLNGGAPERNAFTPMDVEQSADTDSAAWNAPAKIMERFLGSRGGQYQVLENVDDTEEDGGKEDSEHQDQNHVDDVNKEDGREPPAKLHVVDSTTETVDKVGDTTQEAGTTADTRTSLNAANVDPENRRRAPEQQGGTSSEEPQTKTLRSILAEPLAIASLLLYFTFCLVIQAFDEILPLWAIASREKGGFGGSATFIGVVLSITGGLMGVFQVVVYPLLTPFLGPRGMLVVSNVLSIPFYILMPLTAKMPRGLGNVVLVAAVSLTRMAATVAFSSLFLVTNAAAEDSGRGRLNGMSMTIGSVAKALGPLWGSWIFAWSINSPNVVGAPLVFIMLATGSLTTAVLSLYFLPRVIRSK